ncbi:MAG: hypothetical protein IKW54_02220 [Bacteroidales bacterium]|nr:hypothetical protein [Bacteroidales bacterium]MBR5215295.1 hypothetical protein [Bacteroidales bacterium]
MKNYFSFFCLVILLLFLISLFAPSKSGIFLKEEYRDTTIFNVTYRDTTIYNIENRDSIIYTYQLVPVKDTVRINDTLYISLPMSWYWFKDEYADVFCTGYNVSLDSVNYHFREVTKMVEKEITIKPKRFTADAGLSMGKMMSYYYINIDVAARISINDQWSLSMTAGLNSDGKMISPYGELGIRKRLR